MLIEIIIELLILDLGIYNDLLSMEKIIPFKKIHIDFKIIFKINMN